MPEVGYEHLRSLLVAFDESLTEIERLSRLASASGMEVAAYGLQQSPLTVIGRLQNAIPKFEQARLALDGERERIARRLHDAKASLATMAKIPRPLPGSREEWAVEASVRQAERDVDEAQTDLSLLDMRLETQITWDDVRTGLGRVADIGLCGYARYLQDVYLAEARTALRHAAQRVLEARAVYQGTVQELSALAERQVAVQPDLIAPQLVEALEVLRESDGWAPPERPADSVDHSRRGLGGLASRVLARAAGR